MVTETIIPVEETKEEVITFTEQQQKKINEIVETRLARQGKEIKAANETYKAQISNLTNELEQAKNAVKEAKTPLEKSEALDNVDLIKNELDEVRRGNKRLQDEKSEFLKKLEESDKKLKEKDHQMTSLQKQTQMQFAINKQPFIRPSEILLLTERFVKYDDDLKDLIVINEKGMQRYNASGESMSLDEFYSEYIQQNKHQAKSEALGGLGSTESKQGGNSRYKPEELFGPTSDPRKTMALKLADPARYKQMREKAKADGLF